MLIDQEYYVGRLSAAAFFSVAATARRICRALRSSALSVFSQVMSGSSLAEVAVVGGLRVDRAQQVELLDDLRRLEAEHAMTARSIPRRSTTPVPKVLTHTQTGSG